MHPTAAAAMRLVLAVVAMAVIHLALYSTPLPTSLPPTAFWVLAISGLVGAGIGDVFHIHSIQRIGPRLTLIACMMAKG